MRVARGSGNAREMPQHAQNFINAVVEYQDAAEGRAPSPAAMAEILRVSTKLEARQHLGERRRPAQLLNGLLFLAGTRGLCGWERGCRRTRLDLCLLRLLSLTIVALLTLGHGSSSLWA
jgi:hypothetical protein